MNFIRYKTGMKVADELVRSPDDLIECLERVLKHFNNNPDLIGNVHSKAADKKSCMKLRQLGTILSNMQGD